MAIIVVGGHTRNIGKTSVVAGLIAALPEMHWTAFKVTAKYFLDRADAVLVAEGNLGRPEWKGVSLKLVEGTPILAMRPPVYVTEEVLAFVKSRLRAGLLVS